MGIWPFAKKSKRGRKPESGSWLKPETKRAISGILLILFAIVSGFSIFGQAGRVGDLIFVVLRNAMGWVAFVSPVLFAYVGWRLVRPSEEGLPIWRKVGAALLVVGVLGFLHSVGVKPEDALQVASEGKGGGYLGFALSYPVSLALSPIISIVGFLAAIIVGFLMTFNISPQEAWDWFMNLRKPSETEEGEEAEQAEEEVEEGEEAEEDRPRFRIRPFGKMPKTDPAQMALDEEQNKQDEKDRQQAEAARATLKRANKKYTPFPLEILASSSRQGDGGNIEGNKEAIRAALEKFGIDVEMGKTKVGPTVTQYTLRPDEGVRLSQITALQNDLARALKAHPVRIEAPIPNTDLVGIEIPNREVALVRLRDLLDSREFKKSESPLSIALGKDVSGHAVVSEIDRMPHMLIAGATNSGKSVSIHAVLTSLIYRNSPELLRLVLIDPKRVELTAYNGIPHLWGQSVITDTSKALNAFKWALREMDRRYKLLEQSGSRNLFSYNVSNPDETLPFVVIVIDELADLMAKHARDVEGPIVRLAQLARAVGIHLVLATQRPSVNVITGLIKANVPVRVAFKVASQVDSRTILDMSGAEKLVGTGDMLFLAAGNTKPTRLQGGFVSEEEVREAVNFIKEHNEEPALEEEAEEITAVQLGSGGMEGDEDEDEMLPAAKEVALAAGKISASLLQRRLRVGYARAARLIDILEDQGVVGPADGNKPREVLISGMEGEAPAVGPESMGEQDLGASSPSHEDDYGPDSEIQPG